MPDSAPQLVHMDMGPSATMGSGACSGLAGVASLQPRPL